MYRKIGLFFLSLWLFFVLTIIITVNTTIFNTCREFIGIDSLLLKNSIPLACIFCLLIGLFSYWDFSYKLKGANQMPFNVMSIEKIDYEHLTFLTTYIIPLVCFNFKNIRYQLVLVILLVVIGLIYIRTDLFYANPTLALFNYRIYRVNGMFKDGIRNNIILISREQLSVNRRCDYIKLDDRIYYTKLKEI